MALGLRSLLRAREQGPFFYHYEGAQDGDGNIRARSGYSDRYELPLPHSVSVRQYSEDYDLTKLKIGTTDKSYLIITTVISFLRMHYLHLSKKRVVSDSFEYDLSSWLMHKKDTAPYSDANTWWAAIRREFILIFKPVFEGLKILHLREEYHGNLDSESCIKIICKNGNVTRGILTNMEEKVGSKSTLRERDAQHLREIIEKVITFPFIGTSESSEEVRELCLQQLGAYSCQTDLMIKWSLDPVLFWDTRRRIQFLEETVIDINKLTSQASSTFRSLFPSTLRKFVSSAADAYTDLQTLVTLDHDRRLVVSCRPSTLHFLGTSALFSFVAFSILRFLVNSVSRFLSWRRNASAYRPMVRRDRSLGGKEVVVGWGESAVSKGPANPLSPADGGTLKRGAKKNKIRLERKLPKWWPAVINGAVFDLDEQDEFKRQAYRVVRAITDSRMAGNDIMEDDIIQLRQLCRTSGVQVSFETTNIRDSLYRASVNYVLNVCSREPTYSTSIDINGEDARQFLAGFAEI